jgi:hypothetical protein
MKGMKITLWPKTDSGKWAAILCIAFIVLLSFKMNFFLPLPSIVIAIIGLAGFINGVIAYYQKRSGHIRFAFYSCRAFHHRLDCR